MKASHFLPLTQLEVVANHKNKGTLEYLKEVKVLHPYTSLHTDVYKSSLVLFLAEVLKDSIQEEEANPEVFNFLLTAFNWLDKHESYAYFHILFLLKFSQFIGIYPDDSEKDAPYFNLMEGNFQQTYENQYCETGEHVLLFQRFFGMEFEGLSNIKANKLVRSELLNLVLRYYQLHVHGFKIPKSLEIFNQLFK